MIVSQRLLNVHLDLVVEDLWQRLAHARIIQLDKPDIDLITFSLNNIDISLRRQKCVHCAHNDREDQYSNEFNDHRVDVLFISCTVDISVAYRGERGHDPVETGDVDEAAVMVILRDLEILIRQPSSPTFRLTDQYPAAGNHVHNCE